MKTYAEASHEKPFDWNKALDDAIADMPDDYTFCELTNRASLWTTCACGNQCELIPRNSEGAPKDDRLRYLGIQFYESIEDMKPKRAKAILAQIEALSAILIAEELAKK